MKNRRSIRKTGYDYSAPGDYFVTVCTRHREPLLGEILDGSMSLSAFGAIVREEWDHLPERFAMVALDEFVVMPNHVHGIVTIVGAALAAARPADQPGGVNGGILEATISGSSTVRAGASPAPTLGDIIGAFKSLADRRSRQAFVAMHPGRRFGCLWHRNYHEHVITGADELGRIRNYIRNNVPMWANDENYVPAPDRGKPGGPD